MKINFLNQNFKGHAAGRIKALYMTNPGSKSQLNIYNQMREIGQKEGFTVFIHDGDSFVDKKLTSDDIRANYWGVWSQDNKIITQKGSKTILLTSKAQAKDEYDEACLFAANREIDGYDAEIVFDGGNMFLGKRDNGDNYLLTTPWTIYLTGAYHYLKDKNIEEFNRYTFLKFNREGFCYDKNGNIVTDSGEYNANSSKWQEYAKSVICEVFDLKSENLIILPEMEQHLDLVIRPLNYPYVLINSDYKVDNVLFDAQEKFEDDFFTPYQITETRNRIIDSRKRFSSTKEMSSALKNHGFRPIELPMTYGRGAVNFANAIVHNTDDGLVYITNSTKPGAKLNEFFQDEFEKELLKCCPQIKKVYFVSGEPVGKDLNNIMILNRQKFL